MSVFAMSGRNLRKVQINQAKLQEQLQIFLQTRNKHVQGKKNKKGLDQKHT